MVCVCVRHHWSSMFACNYTCYLPGKANRYSWAEKPAQEIVLNTWGCAPYKIGSEGELYRQQNVVALYKVPYMVAHSAVSDLKGQNRRWSAHLPCDDFSLLATIAFICCPKRHHQPHTRGSQRVPCASIATLISCWVCCDIMYHFNLAILTPLDLFSLLQLIYYLNVSI